ncbi:hypothetical protein [Fluviicola chungangensis]|uniref:Uncharacterized protein n=1 Tax=Fluviicola chungangensis TaxID=2597671 RepID=A0A556N7R3_9FLAO|nr:hypothetical protein [Fluviicola chungangensis]TSJ48170.1 hypothetical protein FO442_03265 [Fluviicola chungangensis]
MRISLFFLLSFGLLVISCKKNNPKPLTQQPANYLRHSGTIGWEAFSLNTATISPEWIEMEELDYMDYKTFRIRTWLKGQNLQQSISNGEERYTLDLFFRIPYSPSDYDTSCNCLPTLDATRLANHMNAPSFEWNDLSVDHKNILVLYTNGQFTGGPYHAINPLIFAQVQGNSVRIHGTVDSLETITGSYLKNLVIDYTIPINP